MFVNSYVPQFLSELVFEISYVISEKNLVFLKYIYGVFHDFRA